MVNRRTKHKLKLIIYNGKQYLPHLNNFISYKLLFSLHEEKCEYKIRRLKIKLKTLTRD